jgi:hypothetical protein
MLQMRAQTHLGRRVNCSLLLTDFDQNWNVLANFSKSPHYQNLLKIHLLLP